MKQKHIVGFNHTIVLLFELRAHVYLREHALENLHATPQGVFEIKFQYAFQCVRNGFLSSKVIGY